MQKDKRLFEREPVVLADALNGHVIGKNYRLRNISLGGFSVETDQCITEGERLEFSFSLPESKDIIRLCGRVIWVKQISSNPVNYYVGCAHLINLDKLPVLFPLLLNKEEQARFNKIHFSACSKS